MSPSTHQLLAPISRAVHQIVARDCDPGDNSSRCEKPFDSPKIIGITCGVTAAVLIFGSLALLTVLHIRRQHFERKEDGIDLEIDGDVEDHPTMGKPPPHPQRGDERSQADQQLYQRENPFEPERR